MRVIESCAECLYDKQCHLSKDPAYLSEIRDIIRNRGEEDSAPYLVYLFGRVYEKHFGRRKPYAEIKKKYNDLVLTREAAIRRKIEVSAHPLQTALGYARAGNYIDFGAMNVVEDDEFLKLLEEAGLEDRDHAVMESFLRQCVKAKRFLLIADNCGEIVLDTTEEDAVYCGMDREARIVSSGNTVAGTVYEMLSEEARKAMDAADVILAKGQGNYETMNGQGRHVFYAFLCKCELFTSRFDVPRLTGILVEEKQGSLRSV